MKTMLKTYGIAIFCAALAQGCGGRSGGGGTDGDGSTGPDAYLPPPCPDGTDNDGDRYGDGCPAGPDCNDDNPLVHPDSPEVCNGVDDNCNGSTDEGVLNRCGNCSPGCTTMDLGDGPFPFHDQDPNVEDDGVGLDPNGDLVLDQSNVDFNFMWIANTDDYSIGTVSKIDTENVTEAARYFSVTCFGNSSYLNGSCESVPNPQFAIPIQRTVNNPSRTAVDFNFDVWVANRAFSGQASVTKIANSESDCVDRNDNGIIDTSRDVNGDGHITVDCNGDGTPDGIDTVCTDGLSEPEFLGWDDECVLMTVNYSTSNRLGRSVCLDAGDPYSGGAGNAWVGTNNIGGSNQFFQVNGSTGEIMQTVTLPAGHNPYGCIVDSQGILWSVSQAGDTEYPGRLVYFNTQDPQNFMGVILQPGFGGDAFYGVTVDSDDNIWAGGWGTNDVYRYRPDRTSFGTLANGVWTRVRTSQLGIVSNVAGVAADLRGYIWAAANNGCILRIPQSVGDGDQPGSVATYYGPDPSGSCTLGGNMRGVGVDFGGNVWGISNSASVATRLDVDTAGNPSGLWYPLTVGLNPYTYSDFTGYGLRNFTRPRGTYRYIVPGCDQGDTTWSAVEWSSTEPPNTYIVLRVRTGDGPSAMGTWYGSWDTSPADLLQPPPGGAEALSENPAPYFQLEFELRSDDRESTPILHDFGIIWECEGTIPR